MLWPQTMTFSLPQQSSHSYQFANLTQNEKHSWRCPDHNQTWGVGAEGLQVGENLPGLHWSSRTQQQPRPTTTAAASSGGGGGGSSSSSPAAPRSMHLPEEQEIRKTANANFAAAPIFPRRRGIRRKFSLDIQFPGSSSETNLLV